jgi:predicted nucleic acid-binding protein
LTVLGDSTLRRLIELATEDAIEPFSSTELLAEFAEVLKRDHIRHRLERERRSTPQMRNTLVESILPASITPTAPDPNDATALAAGADLSRLR